MTAAGIILSLAAAGIFAVAAWNYRHQPQPILPQRKPRLFDEFEEISAFVAQARADIEGSGLEPIYELMMVQQARHELADDARIWAAIQ